jgi:hypothetical protein
VPIVTVGDWLWRKFLSHSLTRSRIATVCPGSLAMRSTPSAVKDAADSQPVPKQTVVAMPAVPKTPDAPRLTLRPLMLSALPTAPSCARQVCRLQLAEWGLELYPTCPTSS